MKSQGETTKKVDKIVKVTKDFISSGIGLKKLKSISSIDDYDVIVKNKVQNKTYLIDSSLLGGSGIQTIAEGTNITVDATDPLNPIISATDSSSALFPNGYVEVNESRDFNSGDANKLLAIKSDDITLSMPSVNPFGKGDLVGIQNTNDYKNTHIILKEGSEPTLIGDEVFIFALVDIGGGIYVPQPLTGEIYDENEENEKSITRYLYDQSQNVIPLSGTEIGKPVTGDIEFSDNSTLYQGTDEATKLSIQFKSGQIEQKAKDNTTSSDTKVTTNPLAHDISVNDVTTGYAGFLNVSADGIHINSSNPESSGLFADVDYSSNITDLDYTQKIYVGFRGTATLSSGTVTVTTDKIKTGYKIYLSVNTPSGTQGFLSAPTGSIVDETEFVINSTSATDDSTVNWWIAP